jgi:two-component system KDP operon response regulator KdpE
LLIEDSADIREAVSLILELNFPAVRLIEAERGGDALELMKLRQPDLIMLDLGLPDMDGMHVLREIRSIGNTPVIIMTVRSDESDIVGGLEMGADDYIVKPFSHVELVVRINNVLRCGNVRSTVSVDSAKALRILKQPFIKRVFVWLKKVFWDRAELPEDIKSRGGWGF